MSLPDSASDSSDSSGSNPVDSAWQWLRTAFGGAGAETSSASGSSSGAAHPDTATSNTTTQNTVVRNSVVANTVGSNLDSREAG